MNNKSEQNPQINSLYHPQNIEPQSTNIINNNNNKNQYKNNSLANTTIELNKLSNSQNKYNQFRILKKGRLENRCYSYQNIKMGKPLPDWKQSSAVLRNSSRFFQFSKDARFKQPKVNYFSHQKLDFKSSLSQRATSFGFGQKKKIPEQFLNNLGTQTKNCPFYETLPKRAKSSVSLQPGKTFGLGWSYFERSRTPHRSTVHCADQVKSNPGPNSYDIQKSNKYPYGRGKMHQRLKMFTDINSYSKKAQPNPQSYEIKQNLIKRIKSGTFIGYGNKADFTKQSRQIPGPIYNISGFTDKFTRIRVKNLKQQK